MKFVVAQETKILGTKMAKDLEIIEATTLNEAKEIYMTKFPKATNVYGYQKDEDTTTTEIKEEETMTTNTTIDTSKGGTTNAFIDALTAKGYEVTKADTPNANFQCYNATITDKSGYNTITIFFGGCDAAHITARVDKVNGTHKWYYGKTIAQMLAVVRQCMEGYDWTKPTKAEAIEAMDDDAEDPSVTLDEFIAKAQEIDNMKEETTMNTTTTATLNMKDGIVSFELNGITYTANTNTKRYSKTVDGKTTRIGKAEYDTNWASYEQAILDNQPSHVEVENDLEKPAVLNENGLVDCSKCNCDKCVHRNCMRRNPRNVGGLGECPRLDNGIVSEAQKVAEETGMELAEAELAVNVQNEQKKARKARKSKDIAYEGHGVTLTTKQVDFLLDLKQTNQWDGFDTMFWTDVICDEIEGQFAGKPMTVGAMISTLCEKGLAERSKGEFTDPVTNRTRKNTYMAFTGLGQKIAEELGI